MENKPFKGYATSTDYELLWRLVQEGRCVPAWSFDLDYGTHRHTFCVGTMNPELKQAYIEACENSNLHFIPPTI